MAKKGYKMSEEHKHKIRNSNIGLKRSEITKKRISIAVKGRKYSKEINEKRGLAIKKAWNNNYKLKDILRNKMKGENNPSKRIEVKKKISEKAKNRIVKYKGDKHWNWKGGITPINIKIRQSLEYKLWRKSVFERDGYICRFCGIKGGKLNADHIKPFALFPELRFAIDNGRTLCICCHKKTDTYGGFSRKS